MVKPGQSEAAEIAAAALSQSALPSEAAEIAAAALAIVKPNYATMVYGTLTPTAREQAITGLQQPGPNHATMVYGTLTPTTREEAITGQQQPEDSMGRTTMTDDNTIEPALEVVKKKGRARGGKHFPGHQRKIAKANTH